MRLRFSISSLSDAELLEQYQQTEKKNLLGEIFKRYTGFVFAVCMKYLKNDDLAKDAVMQIFEKLIDDLKQNKVNNLKPWIYVVAKNFCLMQLRSKKHHTQSIDESDFFSEKIMESGLFVHPESESDDTEEKEENLHKALSQLKPEQKECVEMFYLQGKCYKEIEEITGFEYKKIKSLIQNGKRNLKNILAGTSLFVVASFLFQWWK